MTKEEHIEYCLSCGDCRTCYGDTPCTQTENGEHEWVRAEQPLDS